MEVNLEKRQISSCEVSALGEASLCFLGNENLLSYNDGEEPFLGP